MLRNAVDLDSTGAVLAALAGGVVAYWVAWWALVRPDERALGSAAHSIAPAQ